LIPVSRQPIFALCAALLALTLPAPADDLIATNETPAFVLDTLLPAGGLGPGSLIVQVESPPFLLDTRPPTGEPPGGSLILQAEAPPFTLDTRLPEGIVPSSGTTIAESGPFTLDTCLPDGLVPESSFVIAQSPPFTLDTRLPDGISFTNAVVIVESPPFTLDTRLPEGLTPPATLVTQTESPPFTLDTRIPPQDPPYTSLITMAASDPFTLDTLSGWLRVPTQTFTDGSTGGKIRFAPDGLRLAKTDGSRVLLWNLQSSRTNFVFSGHWGEVSSVEFSPPGDQLLTGSSDGTFRWWDTPSRAELGRTNPPGSGIVYATYASDGARVLAGRGANATLYRAPSMQLAGEFSGSAGSISAVAVCPEGLALAGNSDRFALIWDSVTGAILHRLTNHTKLVTAAAFFPGGTNAMTASLDGTIRVWDTATGAELLCIQQGCPVGDAVISADGGLIATCKYDPAPNHGGSAFLWDASSGSLLRFVSDGLNNSSATRGVAISPDRTVFATSHDDGSLCLWNTGLDPQPIYAITPLGIGANLPVTLRSHGLYYFEVEAQIARSLVVTLEADTGGSGGSKALKSFTGSADILVRSAPGLSADAEFANFGPTASSDSMTKSLSAPPANTDITAFRMTGTRGRLPSEYDYEDFAQASVTNLHCEMPVATSTSDKIYVLVFAPYLSAGSINARIRAEYADFHLSSVTPARGGNGGTVTAELLGTGFTPDTAAWLFNASGASVAGQLSLWGDSTKAWFSFDLTGASSGLYNVEIRGAGYVSAVLTNAFTIVEGGAPLLQAGLSAPSAVRPGRDYALTLTYANAGHVDIAAPLFVVRTPTSKPWLYPVFPIIRPYSPSPGQPTELPLGPALPLNPAQKRPQIQTMGPNPAGPVHLLPPGSRNEIPLYFQGDGGVWRMPFTLSILRVEPAPIDWDALQSVLHPTNIAPDLWAAIWANFTALLGSTWQDYARALNAAAVVRVNSGQPTTDVAELLASLFSEAIGAHYRRTLFAAVDASAPAPALPLRFARFTTDGLEHRFSLGPLGRGWSHNYEFTLTQPAGGKIIIRTPGGRGRRFDRGSDNVWRGQAGDYGILAVGAGGFVLTEKDGLTRQFDSGGLLVSVEEPNHNRVTLGYGGSHLTALSHSAGPAFALQYNGQGRLARLTDHAGQVTDYEYDPSGEHLLRVIAPGGVTNSYTYQPVTGTPSDHALTTITFPDGTHQFFAWNSMGRLAEQSRDGGAERLQFTYSSGGVVSVRDDRDAATTLRLGERGQLLKITDPLGHGLTLNYDTRYNLTRLTGPAGDTREMTYDAQGNPNRVINPLAQTVNLNHTGFSRLDTLRDARSQLTDFGYDSSGNLTSIAYPDTSAEQFGYDTAGSVTNWQNRRGQTVLFARNTQGQLIRKTYPDGRTIDYQHDARGLLTNIVDTAGAPTFLSATTSLAYDARGFLSAITYPDGKGFTFDYNAAGRRTRRTGHDGYTLNYSYDAVGRLQSLSNNVSGLEVLYTYDATGRLVGEEKGNGSLTTYTYDIAGQLTALTNYASHVTLLSFFNYTYDAKGNRLTMTTAAGVTSYNYDKLNQLTGVTYPGGRRVTYAYDAAGNRTLVNDSGASTAYTANALNQYTTVGDEVLLYDADGNLTNRHSPLNPQFSTSYFYDTENRLVRVTTPTNGVFQYTYDALGNRTAVGHNGVTNRFLHDPVGLVDVAAEYDATGALVARYDHAIGLVSRTDGAGTAFYSFDALGNTRELTGEAGAVLNSYDYDAFGGLIERTGLAHNSYGYVGRWGVTESDSLLFMKHRFYAPETGIFTATDPLHFGGGLNLYTYCRNNPVGHADPLGLDAGDQNSVMPNNNYYWQEYYMSGAHERGLSPGEWYRRTSPYHIQAQNDVLREVGKAFLLAIHETYEMLNPPRGIQDWVEALLDPEEDPVEIALGPDAIRDTYPACVLDPTNPCSFPSDPIGEVSSPVVRPVDPNDKIGPNGVGPNRVVSAQDEIEYMIRFENFASATAPVQELIVVDYLDAGLDWTTARFKEIAYGDRIVTPPFGSQSFTVRDQPPTNSPSITGSAVGSMVIDVHGSVNPQAGRLEWRMTCLDTNTGIWPQDALSGFLPPEDGTGRGQGYVKFGVRPRSDLLLGTAITNTATIVFDGNDPIATPPVWNIVGDVPSLAVTIAYLPGQVMAGTPFTYTVGLTNTGTSAVMNVILTNALPSGMTVLNTTASLGTVTVTNGALIWDLGTLTSGAGAALTITASATQSGTFANNLYYSGGSGLAIYTAPSDLIVVEPPRPQLTIRLLSSVVELSWPTNASAFRLQSAESIAPAAWSDVSNSPAISGQDYRLQLPPSGAARFFRLVKP